MILKSFLTVSYFNSIDPNPLFVSFYENGNSAIDGGFTIVEIRNKSTGDHVNKFFIGNSKKGDVNIKPASNKSYTYGIYGQQDRSNLFIS